MTKGHKGHDKGQMSDREAMKLALEALEHWMRIDTVEDMHIFETVTAPEAIAVLHKALEQQECAECNGMGFRDGDGDKCKKCGGEGAEPWDTTDMAHRQNGLSMEQDEIVPSDYSGVTGDYSGVTGDYMEQEPVAWRNAAIRLGEDLYSVGPNGYYDMTASQWLDWALSVVNTAPPKRKWKGLTDEEIAESAERMEAIDPTDYFWRDFARAIESKLKEKNDDVR